MLLWERRVKPPAIDGGEPINITTMANSVWRTKAPRNLRSLEPHTFSAGYDPDVYLDVYSLINSQTSITVEFPDASRLVFWGFMQRFEPSDLTEGEFPEATITIVPTNWDPFNGVESSPVYYA